MQSVRLGKRAQYCSVRCQDPSQIVPNVFLFESLVLIVSYSICASQKFMLQHPQCQEKAHDLRNLAHRLKWLAESIECFEISFFTFKICEDVHFRLCLIEIEFLNYSPLNKFDTVGRWYMLAFTKPRLPRHLDKYACEHKIPSLRGTA